MADNGKRKRKLATQEGNPREKKARGEEETAEKSDRTSKSDKKKSHTVTRLAKSDRQTLTEGKCTLFVALPKTFRQKRASALADVRDWLVLKLSPRLTPEQILQSGDSFLAVVFGTTSAREKALKKLQGAEWRWESQPVKLVVAQFGEQSAARETVWSIPVGPLDTGADVKTALESYFAEGLPKCKIAPETRSKVPAGVFSVWFPAQPPWKGKEIVVGNEKRLISVDPHNRCRACSAADHSSWTCPVVNSGKARFGFACTTYGDDTPSSG